jgi:hypothetical protein
VALFAATGLDTADKVASAVCAVLAVVALSWQYLVSPPGSASSAAPVSAAGAGAVVVGGDNNAEVSTRFAGPVPPAAPGASGPASVVIGGTSTAAIRTDVQLWQ